MLGSIVWCMMLRFILFPIMTWWHHHELSILLHFYLHPIISIMFIITVTDKGFLVWNKICVFLFPLESSSIRTCWNRRAFNLHIVAPPLLPSWWLPSTWWCSSPSCSSPLASPLPALCLKNLSHVKGPEWYVWLPGGQHFFAVGLNHHLPSWFTNLQHIFSSNWRRRAGLSSEAGWLKSSHKWT